MISDVEAVARELSEDLRKRAYSLTKEVTGGMGSLRILSNPRIRVEINNDRGILAVAFGYEAASDDDLFGSALWGLCLGSRSVLSTLPMDRIPNDSERLDAAKAELISVPRMLQELESLSEAELAEVVGCVRRRNEQYWRAKGMWPPPKAGAVMKSGKKSSEQEDTLAFRGVFSKDYEQER